MLARIRQSARTDNDKGFTLIEPLMIAVLGAVVGGMIIALYMPIFNIFSLIK